MIVDSQFIQVKSRCNQARISVEKLVKCSACSHVIIVVMALNN